MVGAVAARLTESGSGINLDAGQIGVAGSIYVVGACLGALFFGQLTDRLGRKRLFIATLIIYLIATVATAFAFAPWFFYLVRFFTGAGIGGEYAAVNSAVDELIPDRKSTRLNSSHVSISYAVFCLKKKTIDSETKITKRVRS